MIKKLVCIQCPLGCEIEVELNEKMEVVEIKGNKCPRGYNYAMEEMVDPKRILTTSVKVEGGDIELVSVKTDKPIPKRLLKEAMEVIRKARVKAPVHVGDVVLTDLLGTGANVVATRTIRPKGLKRKKTDANSVHKRCGSMKI